MVTLAWQVVVTILQLILGFYGFWFTWRVLLPVLPAPENPPERIAPFALYYTDPFVNRLVSYLPLNAWFASVLGLLIVALLNVALVNLMELV